MDPDEIRTFADDGYLVVRGAVTGAPFARLQAELTDCQTWVETGRWFGNHLMEDAHHARVIFDPYSHCPILRELVASEPFRGRARAMLAAPIRLDHSKLMCV